MNGLYSGSFDPITIGHIDIIERTAKMVDTLHIVVFKNNSKKGLFNYSQRLDMIKLATEHINNVIINVSEGLVVDYCKDHNIDVIFRGIRDINDVSNEIKMSQINNELGNIETFFIPTKKELYHISSSLVRELYSFDNYYGNYLNPKIYQYIKLLKNVTNNCK